MTPTQVNARTR